MTRYLDTSVAPPKYWEARVDGDALEIDEGSIGTLGKHSRIQVGDPAALAKELAKRTKQKLAKGYVALPDAPPTVDALLASYAPHEVEAKRGDPARAVAKALAELPPSGAAYPRDIAASAVALAARGFVSEARALRDGLDALTASAVGEAGAGHHASLAAIDLAIGQRDSARAHVDAALAMSAEWGAGRRWHQGYAREGEFVAEALLDLGRDDEARALYAALGYHGLASLLSRRRLAWFDEIVASVSLTGFMAEILPLRRARAEGDDAFVTAITARASRSCAGAHGGVSRERLLALSATTREGAALSPERAKAVVDALRGAITRWSGELPALLDTSEFWYAVGAIATLGGDVASELARATTPTQRAQAVATIHRATRDPAARSAVAELARGLAESASQVNADLVADALAASVELGVPVSNEALVATAARVGFLSLGALAAAALRQGDRVMGRHLFGLAPKRNLGTTASVARRHLAAVGDLTGYKFVSDAIPPFGESDRREECMSLAARR